MPLVRYNYPLIQYNYQFWELKWFLWTVKKEMLTKIYIPISLVSKFSFLNVEIYLQYLLYTNRWLSWITWNKLW